MKKICYGLIVAWMLVGSVPFAAAQVSIGIGFQNVSIGINLPLFPQLVPVPGYPVYYAPQVNANYFFYDGMYWVYQDNNWHASAWYNGPWSFVSPEVVPLFVLRIPVRYYRQPPAHFRGWQSNAPPRWGQHWGHEWEQRRSGWDKWKSRSAPAPAPLPVYQRKYSGDRYPRVEEQHTLRSKSYRYQPRDEAVRQHYNQRIEQKASAPAQRGRQEAPPEQDIRRSKSHQQSAPAQARTQPQNQGGEDARRSASQPEQQAPRSKDRGESQEPRRDHGQGHNKDEERGRGH